MADKMPKPGPPRQVSDEEIIQAIMDIEGPFAATTEVGDAVGMEQPPILSRLKELRERGVIGGKQAGHGWGWWVR